MKQTIRFLAIGLFLIIVLAACKHKAGSNPKPEPFPPKPIVKVTGIELSHEQTFLDSSQPLQLVATIIPADATCKDVTWTTSDGAIAAVNQNGLVIADPNAVWQEEAAFVIHPIGQALASIGASPLILNTLEILVLG